MSQRGRSQNNSGGGGHHQHRHHPYEGSSGRGGGRSGGGGGGRYGSGSRRSRSPPTASGGGGYYGNAMAPVVGGNAAQMAGMVGGAGAAGQMPAMGYYGTTDMNTAMLMNAAAAAAASGNMMPMGMWPAMGMPQQHYYGDHPTPVMMGGYGDSRYPPAPSYPSDRDHGYPPYDRRDDHYYSRDRDDDYYHRGGGYRGSRRSRSPPPRRGDRRGPPPPSRPPRNEPPADARENPSRTLFVRNLDFSTTEEQLKEMFEKYGEIKSLFNRMEKRGMVFISYYDLRAAEKAIKEMHKQPINGRVVDVHYSLPKDEDLNSKTCDRTKNQGTILLTLKDGKEPLKNENLREFFGKFGDLKVVREFKNHPNQRFIEFWDSRHCMKAVDEAHGSAYNGGSLDLRFAWDIPRKARRADPHEARSDKRESRPRSPDYRAPVSRDDRSDAGSQSQWSSAPPSSMMPPVMNAAQQAHEQLMSLTAAMSSQGATTLPPSTAAPGTENQTQVVAQMTQLLQLLQQNPVTANTLNPEGTTSDPRILDNQDSVISDPNLSNSIKAE